MLGFREFRGWGPGWEEGLGCPFRRHFYTEWTVSEYRGWGPAWGTGAYSLVKGGKRARAGSADFSRREQAAKEVRLWGHGVSAATPGLHCIFIYMESSHRWYNMWLCFPIKLYLQKQRQTNKQKEAKKNKNKKKGKKTKTKNRARWPMAMVSITVFQKYAFPI